MSAPLSLWLKDVLVQTPGAVRAVAKRELILAAREFYRISGVWRAVLEANDLTVGDYTYTADSPDTTGEVIQILEVEVNALPLAAKVERPRGDRPTGQPTLWYPTSGNTFEVWPTPDMYDVDSMIVRVQLIPTEDATAFPTSASQKHYDALRDGLIGRLYGHPAKPYSNPSLAQYHMNRFRDAIAAAAAESKTGGFRGQNWVFPRFGM